MVAPAVAFSLGEAIAMVGAKTTARSSPRTTFDYLQGQMQTANQIVLDMVSMTPTGYSTVSLSIGTADDSPYNRQTLMGAELFISDADPRYLIGGYREDAVPSPPGTGAYATPRDKLTVYIMHADNSTSQRVVSAPKDTLFLSDDYTLDLENADVVNWWTVNQSFLVNRQGSPATAMIRGIRWFQ